MTTEADIDHVHVEIAKAPTAAESLQRGTVTCRQLHAVLDLVRPTIKRLGRLAARRWGVDVADATQDAWVVVVERINRGLPLDQVLRYAEQHLLSPTRSPLRPGARQTDRLTTSHTQDRSDDLLPTSEVRRALLESGGSSAGPQLDAIEAGAPARCPICRRKDGDWVTWVEGMGDGVRQSDKDRWEHTRALMLPGQATVAEEQGRRKARDTQVWMCSRCHRWTYEPIYRCAEGAAPVDPDDIQVHQSHGGGSGEDRMIAYCEMGLRARGRRA